MTVSDEEWEAVAVDLNTTVEKLKVKIEGLNQSKSRRFRRDDLPELHYDRDLDPITFGEWAFLYEASSYRTIANTDLPDYWVVTIWRGIDVDLATRAERDHPFVMETAVFSTSDGTTQQLLRVPHASLADARVGHDRLVARGAKGELPKPN
jgi:hypothetical protein